jgi:hypothetical protein
MPDIDPQAGVWGQGLAATSSASKWHTGEACDGHRADLESAQPVS